ncbi:hypothetical protein, partial [Pseudomonas sp. 2995-1]|uniref:hypothetical protein n=1 Tax=Pseudomonas sp. 2995-1 TaxID=1712679 RepID=UPI001C452BDE
LSAAVGGSSSHPFSIMIFNPSLLNLPIFVEKGEVVESVICTSNYLGVGRLSSIKNFPNSVICSLDM